MRTLLLLALLAPVATLAAGGPDCHCFRDRTFDPARPTAADPYILATTRSSLLSAAFGVEKASLVRAVMSGTSPDDLWVAHYAAARTGGSAGALLEAKVRAGSWKILAVLPPQKLGEPFVRRLAGGALPADLAAAAVDEVLTTRVGADPAALRALRAAGASTEQAILATVLGVHLNEPAADVLAPVAAGKASWGALLRDAGVEPSRLDSVVRQRVK